MNVPAAEPVNLQDTAAAALMETSKASSMPPPFTMSPKASAPQDPSSDSACARSNDFPQLRDSAALVEPCKASLMPPPPPMPPKASAGQTALVNLSASGDDTCTPSETQSTQTSLQTSNKKEKGNDVQSSFNNSIYSIPSWSAAPAFPFTLEVIKDGALVDTLEV
ncbi:hypothetical protein L7F22_008484 [Adiantum nelumboides]|nr:hypothetical protein [Adiantum nelumboides]